jgi:hypothetical protein
MLNKIKAIKLEDIGEPGHFLTVEILEGGDVFLKIEHENNRMAIEIAIVDGDTLFQFLSAHLKKE